MFGSTTSPTNPPQSRSSITSSWRCETPMKVYSPPHFFHGPETQSQNGIIEEYSIQPASKKTRLEDLTILVGGVTFEVRNGCDSCTFLKMCSFR